MKIVDSRRARVTFMVLATLLSSTACGQISDDSGESIGGTDAGRGGSAGSAGRGGAAGRGGSSGRSGSGSGGSSGSAMPDAGNEGGAAGTSMSSGDPVLPADCPEINAIPAPGQRIVIQSMNFNDSTVVLRNVSDEPVTIIGNRNGWQWCNFPAYWAITENGDVTLAPDETFAFTAIYNTTGPREFDPEGGEMGIYTATGSFTQADLMVAFVSWGDILPMRESTASMAGVWAFGDRIEMDENAAGFVVVGEADRAEGYQAVRAACLVPPPNE